MSADTPTNEQGLDADRASTAAWVLLFQLECAPITSPPTSRVTDLTKDS